MSVNVAKEVAALRRLTMRELRARHADAFRERTNANNKAWLIKRIAWRLQADAEGDLSERARRRAAELANDADLRLSPPKPKEAPATDLTRVVRVPADESRLPPPGTVITREYKGETLQVTVLAGGFDLYLDGTWTKAGVGDLVRMPMGLPHGYYNRGAEPARALFWVSPARSLKALFEALHNLTDLGEAVRLSALHEVDFLPPGSVPGA